MKIALHIILKNIKRITFYFLLLLLVIICFESVQYVSQNLREAIKRSKKTSRFFRDTSTCSPVRNIAYLKPHKTASSSVQGILFRYGLQNDLHFAIPDVGNYFGRGRTFRAGMISKRMIGNFTINIFAIHTKWDFQQVKSVMPNDTIYISSVRDPVGQFESMFIYSDFEKVTGMDLNQYVNYKPINSRREYGVLGFNQLVYDFGVPEEEIYNKTYITKFILEADEQFDFVLVAEEFDQSLVLLRHLLCWSFEDLVTFKVNAIKNKHKKKLEPDTLSLLKRRLSPDQRLYDHFNNKLGMLEAQLGKETMRAELRELRNARLSVKQRCNLQEADSSEQIPGINKPYSKKVIALKGNLNETTCELHVLDEVSLLNKVRDKQRKEVIKKFGNMLPLNVPHLGVPLSEMKYQDMQTILRNKFNFHQKNTIAKHLMKDFIYD